MQKKTLLRISQMLIKIIFNSTVSFQTRSLTICYGFFMCSGCGWKGSYCKHWRQSTSLKYKSVSKLLSLTLTFKYIIILSLDISCVSLWLFSRWLRCSKNLLLSLSSLWCHMKNFHLYIQTIKAAAILVFLKISYLPHLCKMQAQGPLSSKIFLTTNSDMLTVNRSADSLKSSLLTSLLVSVLVQLHMVY